MASGKQSSLSFLFNAKKAAGFNKTFAAVNQSIQGIGKSLAWLATAYISVDALKSVASTAGVRLLSGGLPGYAERSHERPGKGC